MAALTSADAQALVDDVDYILLDIDGVLWAGDHVFYGVPETLRWLAHDKGKKLRFVTNNATRTRTALKDVFHQRGIDFVDESMIFTSAYVAALTLKDRWKQGRADEAALQLDQTGSAIFEGVVADEADAVLIRQKSVERLESDRYPYNVFVVGEKGLHDELREVALAPSATTFGLEIVHTTGHPILGRYVPAAFLRCVSEPLLPVGPRTLGAAQSSMSIEDMRVGAVVVGLDTQMNNFKLAAAGLCMQHAERTSSRRVDFIATNEDPQFPVGTDGYVMPGAGAMVSAVATFAGRAPDVVCGKPHLPMAQLLMEVEGIADPRRCLMIGDRLSTDIAFGRAMGARTLLVLTGCEGVRDIAAAPEAHRPEFFMQSLGDMKGSGPGMFE